MPKEKQLSGILPETGTTLLENNLEPYETILPISARLIANKASYKFHYDAIRRICETIQKEGMA